MRTFTVTTCLCAVFLAYATNAQAYNYIFVLGKDGGGEMMCSDWNGHPTRIIRAAMIQWIFGFLSGYDAAIRPNDGKGGLNGQQIGNLITDVCKKNPNADLVSVAKYVAEYMQKEIKGDVSPPTILDKEAAEAASEPDPDSWFLVKDTTNNSCSVVIRPKEENLTILTSFKAFVTGDKAIGSMVREVCGCNEGCSFKLPGK